MYCKDLRNSDSLDARKESKAIIMNVDNVLNSLNKVRNKGYNSWVACCPVHAESTPSFCITVKGDKVIVKCFGCGAGAVQVMEALPHLTWDDFLPERLEPTKRDYKHVSFPAADILAAMAFEAQILQLAAQHIKNGDKLSDNDNERLHVACDRIIKAANYAR
jgi:hypothetical protein